MRIKKYVADSMPEALKQVKADLGPRAVILNTRTLRKGGALGLGKKGQVEVTAAVDSGVPGKQPAKKAARKIKRTAPEPSPKSVAPDSSTSGAGWLDQLTRQIADLQAAIRTQPQDTARTSRQFLPGALGQLCQRMESSGLDQGLIEDVLRTLLEEPPETGLKELASLQTCAVKIMASRVPAVAPTRVTRGVRSVVATVGMAGAGKTTAVARIAAQHAAAGRQVLLVAGDTDRVGGLEQLRAYAGILGIAVEVAHTPEDMGEVIRSCREVDLLLIDTAGVSPMASDQIAVLGALLREAAPNEVHLTMSATTDLLQMRETVTAFSTLGADRLLFTKLDEATRWGGDDEPRSRIQTTTFIHHRRPGGSWKFAAR